MHKGMKQQESETDAYKAFMKVAKRVQKVDYAGKWKISVDPDDPLRKFTLDRDIGWATLKLGLSLKESYRRGVYDNNRTWYKPYISFTGLFHDKDGGITMQSGMKLRPRLAKELITTVNEKVIPGFYKQIAEAKTQSEEQKDFNNRWARNIAKVTGLVQSEQKDSWRGPIAKLDKCPFNIELRDNKVALSAELTYDQLAAMAKLCGWGG